MTCSNLTLGDGTVATICRGPATREIHRAPHGETRWCFRCRTRLPFFYVVIAPVGPSYYGPDPRIECAEGHSDGDCFPGRYREWEGW